MRIPTYLLFTALTVAAAGSLPSAAAVGVQAKPDAKQVIQSLVNSAAAAAGGEKNTLYPLLAVAKLQMRIGDKTAAQATFKEALKVVANMPMVQQPVSAGLDVVKWQARAGDKVGAQEACRAVIAMANAMGGPKNATSVWPDIAAVQAFSGDIAGANATAAEIADVRAGTITIFGKTLAYQNMVTLLSEVEDGRAMDLAAAREIAEQLNSATPSVRGQALMQIATGQAGTGDAAGAKATLTQLITEAKALTDRATRESFFDGIARLEANSGDIAAAKATVFDYLFGPQKDAAYAAIAVAQAERGDFSGALTTLGMVSNANVGAQTQTRSNIAAKQAEKGDIAGAKTTLGRTDDVRQKDTAYLRAVRAGVRGGNPAAAKQLAAEITTASVKKQADDEVAVGLVIAQADAGDIAGARAALPQLEPNTSNAILHIVKALAKAGDLAGVAEMIKPFPAEQAAFLYVTAAESLLSEP